MGQLPKTSSLMDLNQVVDLTGNLSWYLSNPSTISFGDTALLTIKGDAPPFTWAIVGAAAGMGEYSLKYTQTKKLQNVLYSDIDAVNLPIVEVVDARGNRITQSMIEIPLPPTADLTGDTPVVVGISGDYDASGSTPGVGASIKRYEWDWKYDGLSFTPSGDLGSTNSHAYGAIGNYIAAVRVTDNYNRTDIDTLEVVVSLPTADVFTDTFTDSNKLLNLHTSDSGHSWQVVSGYADIFNNVARFATGLGVVTYAFAGNINGVLNLTNLILPGNTEQFRMYFRWLDANNHYRIQWTDAGILTLTRVVGGTPSVLQNIVTGDTFNPAGENMRVTVAGDGVSTTFTIIKELGGGGETTYGPYTDNSPWIGGSQIGFYGISGLGSVSIDSMTYTSSA